MLRHGAAELIRHPDVRPVESHSVGCTISRERPKIRPVTGTQLGHRAAAAVRHPDVRPVESYTIRENTGRERAEIRPVAGAQLRHRAAAAVRHPDVRPIKSHCSGVIANCERSKIRPVTGPQLRHRVAAEVRHPDVRPIESHFPGGTASGETYSRLVGLIPPKYCDLQWVRPRPRGSLRARITFITFIAFIAFRALRTGHACGIPANLYLSVLTLAGPADFTQVTSGLLIAGVDSIVVSSLCLSVCAAQYAEAERQGCEQGVLFHRGFLL